MSIKSTQVAMGYSEFTASTHRCPECKHADQAQAGLRCQPGGFFVTKSATCNNFDPRAEAHEPPRIHIGPTDI